MQQFLNIFSLKFLKGIGQSVYNIQTVSKFMSLIFSHDQTGTSCLWKEYYKGDQFA